MYQVESIPQARIVRQAGRVMAQPPPLPQPPEEGSLAAHARTVLVYAIGLWPLTCVVLVMLGLLVMAGHNGAP